MVPVINLSVKFDANTFISDRWSFNYFADLAAKCLFVPILGRFLGEMTPKCSRILWRPQKAHPWPETHVLAYRLCRSVKKCDLGARWRKQKKKKRNWEMWQVTYLPRPPTLHYPQQSCHVGWGPGHSQPCQVSSKSVQGFCFPEGWKSAIFLCLALWLI